MDDPDTLPDSTLPDSTSAKPKSAPDAIDTRLVRRLADILKDTGLTEIEVERGDLKIRVARKIPAVQVATALAAPAMAPIPTAAATPAVMTNETGPERRGEVVKSPMVGTVYLQAQPGQPPLARVGERVSEGQTLMIIEAMKTMNPIPAPRAGLVLEVLVGDAQPVEYGEPLVVIE